MVEIQFMAALKISKYFFIHGFCFRCFFGISKINWHYIWKLFIFMILLALISLASGKLKCILDEKKLKDWKNVVMATCATWDSNCYLLKYHAIPKFWPGKNIFCFFIKNGILCRWMQREKNILQWSMG